MKMYKQLLLALFSCALVACSTTPPPAPTAEPKILTLQAAANVNPNIANRASPVYVTVMQLTEADEFKHADYFALQNSPEKTLNQSLVNKRSILMTPGTTKKINLVLDANTKYIGVIAAFTNINANQWRVTIPAKQASITVKLNNNNLLLAGE